ncbi:unnamed protein product, partial [Chrysoparadoxa australica]
EIADGNWVCGRCDRCIGCKGSRASGAVMGKRALSEIHHKFIKPPHELVQALGAGEVPICNRCVDEFEAKNYCPVCMLTWK